MCRKSTPSDGPLSDQLGHDADRDFFRRLGFFSRLMGKWQRAMSAAATGRSKSRPGI